jgi:hypothetical protein
MVAAKINSQARIQSCTSLNSDICFCLSLQDQFVPIVHRTYPSSSYPTTQHHTSYVIHCSRLGSALGKLTNLASFLPIAYSNHQIVRPAFLFASLISQNQITNSTTIQFNLSLSFFTGVLSLLLTTLQSYRIRRSTTRSDSCQIRVIAAITTRSTISSHNFSTLFVPSANFHEGNGQLALSAEHVSDQKRSPHISTQWSGG